MGKAAPLKNPQEQRAVFDSCTMKTDYTVIQRGPILCNIPRLEARGYYREVGTNLVCDPNTVLLPQSLIDAALVSAASNLQDDEKLAKKVAAINPKTQFTEDIEKAKEAVLAAVYGCWSFLQGPVYTNGAVRTLLLTLYVAENKS